MSKENGKIVALTIKEILMYLIDFGVGFHQVFDRHQMYRKHIQKIGIKNGEL